MENLKVYNNFREVPKEAKKTIEAGRLRGFTDINPMWRIKKLTEQFGMCGVGWYYEITEQKIEVGSDDQKSAFVTINLYVKTDGEWSKPIIGIGGSSFIAKEKSGLYTSDECFKMAFTDALSIACKSLGMAADVYFEKDKTKYDNQIDVPNQKDEDVKNKVKEAKSVEEVGEVYKKYKNIFSNNAVLIQLCADRKKEILENK